MVQAGAKGKYVKRPIEASAVTDVRLLQIPLVAAERACTSPTGIPWASARA